MQDIHWMWMVIVAVIGVCSTGFFHLNTRLNKLADHIDTSKRFDDNFSKLIQDVCEIKEALLGNFEKPGLIRKVYKIDEEMKALKCRVEALHNGE